MGTDDTRKPGKASLSKEGLNEIVARAKALNNERMQGYREQSLKIHPWVCARCGRHFTLKTLSQLTVHHKDHNHNNNPPDGSNWENLCVYCHDHEHGRDLGDSGTDSDYDEGGVSMSTSPFARLGEMLKEKEKKKKGK
ncbi:HNH nuclease family protein [bacterium]|nr:HNH nuclease family protein [bacterium]